MLCETIYTVQVGIVRNDRNCGQWTIIHAEGWQDASEKYLWMAELLLPLMHGSACSFQDSKEVVTHVDFGGISLSRVYNLMGGCFIFINRNEKSTLVFAN